MTILTVKTQEHRELGNQICILMVCHNSQPVLTLHILEKHEIIKKDVKKQTNIQTKSFISLDHETVLVPPAAKRSQPDHCSQFQVNVQFLSNVYPLLQGVTQLDQWAFTQLLLPPFSNRVRVFSVFTEPLISVNQRDINALKI